MFNSEIEYTFIQTDRGGDTDLHISCSLYKFFVRSQRTLDVRKYIVEVKYYGESLYTIDYYAKLSTRKHPNKYKLKTNQYTFGQVGSTMLRIMASIINVVDSRACFGILAATLIEEGLNNESNKRFHAYSRTLSRVAERKEVTEELNPFKNVAMLAIEEISSIFVITEPRTDDEKQHVVDRYQEIFRDVF
jgi:hypothetical protein